jgi:probable rRNA maturation factor
VWAYNGCVPLTIEISDEQTAHATDHARLRKAVRLVLQAASIRSAEISIAIVTDEQMHALNRQYLDHDYPTDVLSFVLERDESAGRLEGEIVVSADYADREAAHYGWTTNDELLLYVIHGCLHLVGHDDQAPQGQAAMRAAEAKHLAEFGLKHRYDDLRF